MPSSSFISVQNELDSGVWLKREKLFAQFEDAWLSSGPPNLRQFWSEHEATLDVLVELIHTDLEYRLNRNENLSVADYLDDFPEIATQKDLLIDLIESEFRLRYRLGKTKPVSEYVVRFPDLRAELSARLSELEEEESKKTQVANRPTRKAPKLEKIGRYRLDSILGQGSFGAVYKGYDPELDRTVAVKILHAHRSDSPDQVARFVREGRATSQLRHPNLLAVLDVGQENDVCYLVSAYLSGGTILERLQSDNRPNFNTSAEWVAQLAEGLAYAHENGVIHRDIKPANLLLDEKGHPQLADFGLARRVDVDPTLTAEGQIMGTPTYMSPEQVRAETVDPRSDIYSLGATLFHLLTGSPPFSGGIQKIFHCITNEETPSPRKREPNIPKDLDTICRKAMAKLPKERYSTALAFAEDLRRFLRGDPVKARPLNPVEKLIRWTKKNPVVSSLSLGIFGVTLLGATLFAWKYVEAQDNAQRAEDRKTDAINAHIKGEERANTNRTILVEVLKEGVIDGLEPITLRKLPNRLLEELSQNLRLTIQQTEKELTPTQKAELYSALALSFRLQERAGEAVEATTIAISLRSPSATPDRISDDHFALGCAFFQAREFTKALDQFQKAKEGLIASSEQPLKVAALALFIADAEAVCLNQNAMGKKHSQAISKLDEAKKYLTLLEAQNELSARERYAIACYCQTYGQTLLLLKQNPVLAKQMFDKASERYETLVMESPLAETFSIKYTWVLQALGDLAQQAKENPNTYRARAVAVIQSIILRKQKILERYPNQDQARSDLATIQSTLAQLYDALNYPSDAVTQYRQSADHFLKLYRETRDHGQFRGARTALKNLNRLLIRLERYPDALSVLEERAGMTEGNINDIVQVNIDFNTLKNLNRPELEAGLSRVQKLLEVKPKGKDNGEE